MMKMTKTLAALTVTMVTTMAATMVAIPAVAHEVWVERDASGPARIYLGEPAEVVPEAGDPEFHHLQKPQIVQSGNKPIAFLRRANHIEAAVPGNGDVRVRDDSVFAPWKSGEKMQGAIFYARAGRSEAAGNLDLELVPVAANADRFTLLFRGKPVPDAKLTVITPDHWQKAIVTDANGGADIPALGTGRYIVGASHTEDGPAKLGGQDVGSIMHISTLTFVR
jgi:uncharacterized GH25 family protein